MLLWINCLTIIYSLIVLDCCNIRHLSNVHLVKQQIYKYLNNFKDSLRISETFYKNNLIIIMGSVMRNLLDKSYTPK